MSPDFKNGFDVPDDQKERHYDVFEEVTVIAHYLRHLGVLRGHFGARALCTASIWALRSYRFCGRASGLCEETVNARSKHSMSECSLSLTRSWLCSDENACLIAQRRDRFLAALDQAPVEALRTLFLEDLLARPLEKEEKAGGLWDRQGRHWLVFDVDGTRQAARVSRPTLHA